MARHTAGDVTLALNDPSPVARRSLAELAGARGGVRLTNAELEQLLSDPEAEVVEAACFAAGESADGDRRGLVERLVEIATGHEDPLCRESAVAAIGAIGHPAGLGAVLAATKERPAVRRRAVVALAAYSGPEVEAALEAARNDRDWQVRQAAEDIAGR
ncbi:MAG: HEAT repeat domain-containing protein [Acidimicrobiales bacterium]